MDIIDTGVKQRLRSTVTSLSISRSTFSTSAVEVAARAFSISSSGSEIIILV